MSTVQKEVQMQHRKPGNQHHSQNGWEEPNTANTAQTDPELYLFPLFLEAGPSYLTANI